MFLKKKKNPTIVTPHHPRCPVLSNYIRWRKREREIETEKRERERRKRKKKG